MKKFLCVLLAVVFTFSAAISAGAASFNHTCDYAPTIVIPGIGQSKTFLVDENGNKVTDDDGDVITGWPLYFDTDYAVKQLVAPLLLSLAFQRDVFLSDTTYKTAKELLKWNSFDSNGKNNYNIQVEKYPYSLAECSEEEKAHIYGCVPLTDLTDIAGEDHLYYFAYNSFGNNIEIVDELYDFIQTVKQETGHDKVNLVPISLGGTIANGLLEYYPEVTDDINRVVYVVPALNGSSIVGDVYKGKLSTSDEMLYDVMFPLLTDDTMTGNLINIAIRILPKHVILSFLDALVKGMTDGLLLNCTTMWSLVPKEDYPELREKLLSGSEHDVIRAQTDRYYEAQCNSLKNIQAMKDKGIDVFDIVDYSVPLYCLVESWDKVNADGIIQIESTGMGVDSVPAGEALPADYQQKNENKLGTNNCTDETHNHISPDREVDASTALLPDRTFFFYRQDHEDTGDNDVIMKLAVEILTNENMVDVYSNPNYPQFNNARDISRIQDDLLPKAKEVDLTTLSAEDASALTAAIEKAENFIENTVVVLGEDEAIAEELDNILVKIGVNEPPEDNTAETIGRIIFEIINKILNKTLGYRGFCG